VDIPSVCLHAEHLAIRVVASFSRRDWDVLALPYGKVPWSAGEGACVFRQQKQQFYVTVIKL
jgi:hypothetical protein